MVRGRGGYCFEQNGLLFEVLQELGFDARIQLARVIHNQDIHPGLTHRVTLVEIDGRDVRGRRRLRPARSARAPSRCRDAGRRADDGARFRVHEARPGEFHMQSIVDGERYSLYRFDLVRYGQSDCELGHFYSHRHPEATFVNNLVASRILDDEVRSLRNREYWVIRDGRHDDDRHHERRAAARTCWPPSSASGSARRRASACSTSCRPADTGTNASTGESPWGQPSPARPPGPHTSVDPAHTRRWIARPLRGT